MCFCRGFTVCSTYTPSVRKLGEPSVWAPEEGADRQTIPGACTEQPEDDDLCGVVFPGRKFVSILMRFWYLTSARLPEDTMEGTRVFQVAVGGEGEAKTKRLLTANYEWEYFSLFYGVSYLCASFNICSYLLFFSIRFQREFTQGVAPDWTITRIEHSKLLDWRAFDSRQLFQWKLVKDILNVFFN